MIPKSKVVVYYITPDGEIISDSAEIEFENELVNFVKIELSKEEIGPNKNISISISSNPNSFVGVLGVDQSVLLLKKGNDIERNNVLSELDRYNDINRYNYVYTENYDWRTRLDFENSNAFIITNAKNEFGNDIFGVEHFFITF
jgi:CD109 antigen